MFVQALYALCEIFGCDVRVTNALLIITDENWLVAITALTRTNLSIVLVAIQNVIERYNQIAFLIFRFQFSLLTLLLFYQ